MAEVLRVLVSGSRDGYPGVESALDYLLYAYREMVVIEGCASGVDRQAENWARAHGVPVEHYPAQWATYGRAAGPLRNRQMLDAKPDIVLAFHANIEVSKGTKDMLKQARRRGVPARLNAWDND